MRLVYLCLIILLFGCKSDPPIPAFDGSKIAGRWIITDAVRKNRSTQTINGAIFEISDTTLVHNMYGQDSTFKISWGPHSMITATDTFFIETNLDSLLILTCVLQRFPFRLSLKKLKEYQSEELE